MIPADPDVAERFAIVLEHARNAVAFENDEVAAMRDFRKHLGWYTKGLPAGKALREELFRVTRLEEASALLERYLERYAEPVAA